MPTILFIHLYKMGGSAIFQLLRDYAAAHGLPFLDYTTWIRKQRGLETGGGELELSAAERDYMRRFEIIGGHMWYGKHRYFDQHVYITMLREPRLTAVSEILFDSRTTRSTHATTLEQAVAEVQAYLDAHRAQHRCDMIDRLVGQRRAAPLGDKLAIAQEHLASIEIIGLLERLDSTLDLIATRLSLVSRTQLGAIYQASERNAIPYAFTSQQVVRSLSPSYLAQLEDFVCYEQALYEFAKPLHLHRTLARSP